MFAPNISQQNNSILQPCVPRRLFGVAPPSKRRLPLRPHASFRRDQHSDRNPSWSATISDTAACLAAAIVAGSGLGGIANIGNASATVANTGNAFTPVANVAEAPAARANIGNGSPPLAYIGNSSKVSANIGNASAASANIGNASAGSARRGNAYAAVGDIGDASATVPPEAASQEQAPDGGLTIRFLASPDPGIREVQQALVETWGYVSTSYLDPTYNSVNWQKQLQESLDESFGAKTPKEAYDVINTMLAKLGDPFTRFLPPEEGRAFENATEGETVSLGLQISVTPDERVRVAVVIEDSPAERAGVLPGDFLLAVNGRPVDPSNKMQLAAELRQEADLLLRRERESPGEGDDARSAVDIEEISLHLVPELIEVHPVQYALLPGEGSAVGYIRCTLFSLNAPTDLREAIEDLQKDGAARFILDLRDNVGGVVEAGYEIAQLLLSPEDPFTVVVDSSGAQEEVPVQDALHLISPPLVVLVNGGTASTSELLAAALHDSGGATLLGEKTFGKGRTQRVISLSGGSKLLLSNLAFLTPNRQVIDKVGLEPDVACVPEIVDDSFFASGREEPSSLRDDPCIAMAESRLLASTD